MGESSDSTPSGPRSICPSPGAALLDSYLERPRTGLYDAAAEPLEKRMRRAAGVYLGAVATSPTDDFEGEIPDLSIPPKAGPLRAP